MKRYLGMNIMRAMLLAFALVAAACGGEKSVASRSAAAYREAQAKGAPAGGGHEHGGHAATETTAGATMDHSAHGTGGDAHAGMSHGTTGGAMDHSAHGGTGAVDHAAMGHGSTSANAHAGHTARPGTGGSAHDQHAAMQHPAPATAAADPHAQHGAPTATAQMDHSRHGAMQMPSSANAHAQHGSAGTPAPIAVQAPRSNAEMQRLQPAATLRGDAFDAPSPLAVSEAAKAAQGGNHSGHDMSAKKEQ